MTAPKIARYGSWHSPITTDLVTAGAIGLERLQMDGPDIYWTEVRPTEKGRSVLVRRTPDGAAADVTPAPFNVRSRVHEYGGGAFTVVDGTVYFVNFADQHLYRQAPGQEPAPLNTEPGMRYADFALDRSRSRLYCIREDHTAGGHHPVNSLVCIDLATGSAQVLAEGNDFYASPRLSPDGRRLAWLTWNHPNMPWDGTELWLAEFGPEGGFASAVQVAGGPEESIFQPEWSPEGQLYFVSDRTGWWNLYRLEGANAAALCPMEAEFGRPQWSFGVTTYGFAGPDRIICSYTRQGRWHLASLTPSTGELQPYSLPYTEISGLQVREQTACFFGGAPNLFGAAVQLDLTTGEYQVLRQSCDLTVDPDYLSAAMPVEFPTAGGLTAHAFYYAPKNPHYTAPVGERPPMVVLTHGGPTGSTSSTLSLSIQYWTSRGFAILDVNYGGSTGYGRAYRQRLNGNWGVVDVDDACYGARFMVEQGRADGSRLVIKGGSAGGYTTLAALTFRNVFRTGVSLFGISDLETLAADTHKFESRYMDRLVGPYPEAKETYYSRSPIHFTDGLSCSMLFFQGLDDKVVPPSQAEAMVAVLRQKGLPVAYVPFEGEGHGFRKAENNRRTLEAQLYFFARIFGFEPADPIEPLVIDNLA